MACTHPPRQWHYGELLPCADPTCRDTSPGNGLVILSADYVQFKFNRSWWDDLNGRRWQWNLTADPVPARRKA